MSVNPFETPAFEPSGDAGRSAPRAVDTAPWPLLTWIFICTISAIPSFVLGWGTAAYPWNILGMSSGILLFAFGYRLLDHAVLYGFTKSMPQLRRAMKLGFGGRMLVSLIVPVGGAIDMIPGLISVGIVRRFQPIVWDDTDQTFNHLSGLIPVLATTLIQGLLLNLILWPVILMIYSLLKHWAKPDESIANVDLEELPGEDMPER